MKNSTSFSLTSIPPGMPDSREFRRPHTDVASASLRGRLSDPLRSRLAGESLCITFVTLGELTKWTVLRSWGPQRLAELAR